MVIMVICNCFTFNVNVALSFFKSVVCKPVAVGANQDSQMEVMFCYLASFFHFFSFLVRVKPCGCCIIPFLKMF